jgi:hypothetical protein
MGPRIVPVDLKYMCLAQNPERKSPWAWRCSLDLGHAGPHRAHHDHDINQRYQEWSATSPGAPQETEAPRD